MKTSSKILIIIFAAVLMLAVLGSAAVSALCFKSVRTIGEAVEKTGAAVEQTGKAVEDTSTRVGEVSDIVDELKDRLSVGEDVAQENDVCIASEYYIRDTSAVSDAYKSGDASALDDRRKETLKMASDLLDEIITDGMTDYEKEEAVYKWLTTHLNNETGMLTVIPTTSEDCDNPFGVLKYRSAVCVGYATTFRLLMHMLDIECMVVHDSSLSHSWDLVTLDGDHYHVDCYFDTGCTYRHFNLNDNAMSYDHSWNTDFFPKANGSKYSYALLNTVEIENVLALPEFVMGSFVEGKMFFSCRFKNFSEEDEAAAIYMADRVHELLSSNYSSVGFEHFWTVDDDGRYVLSFYCKNYGSDPNVGLDDKTVESIEKQLEDVFGYMYISPSYSYGY